MTTYQGQICRIDEKLHEHSFKEYAAHNRISYTSIFSLSHYSEDLQESRSSGRGPRGKSPRPRLEMAAIKIAALSLLVGISLITQDVSAISCKNEEGVSVDSWTIMKLPKSTDYFYYDADAGMSQSAYSLNDTSAGALTYTVLQLWKDPSVQYMLYNDEPPNQTAYNFSVAHSKGIWMWDSKSAVVVTHSIPKFPSGPQEGDGYMGLQQNAWEYGQAASCFQMSADYLPKALSSIQLTAPLVYERQCNDCYGAEVGVPRALRGAASNPCSVSALDDGRILFMKPSTLQVDIWASCIAPYFSSDVRVESWIHGTTDGAFCPPEYAFETTDIQSLAFPNGKTVIEYDDHSKWGILDSPVVCFGDLNRVTTQMQRAGTVYCWKDGALWSQLDAMIQETNSC